MPTGRRESQVEFSPRLAFCNAIICLRLLYETLNMAGWVLMSWLFRDSGGIFYTCVCVCVSAYHTVEISVSVLPLYLCSLIHCLSPALNGRVGLCSHTDSGRQLRAESMVEMIKQTSRYIFLESTTTMSFILRCNNKRETVDQSNSYWTSRTQTNRNALSSATL